MSSVPESQEENRNRSIRQAVKTSVFSKFGTVILRLISIPVAIRVLEGGMAEFGVYATIMVVTGMIDSLHVGIGPALTQGISRAVAVGDRDRERGIFATALLLSGGLTLLIASVALLLVWFVPIVVLFGEKFAPFADSMRRACLIAIVLVAIEVICIVCEKARDGYLETRYNNAWGAMGNFLGATVLLGGIWFFPTIEFLVLAITGSLVVAKLANAIHLIVFQRRYLFPRFSAFRSKMVKLLCVDGARFTVTYGLSALIEYSAVAYLIGRLAGPAAAGVYAVMVTVHFSLTGLVQMVTIPTWPALVDARTRGDLTWIRRSGSRLQRFGPAFALAAGLGLVIFGPWALPLWIGDGFNLDRAGIAAFSLYFFFHIWRHVNQLLVIGLGKINSSVWVILIESALVLGMAAIVLSQGANLGGVYLAMAGSLALVSGWIFPAIYAREIRRLGSGRPGDRVDAALPAGELESGSAI